MQILIPPAPDYTVQPSSQYNKSKLNLFPASSRQLWESYSYNLKIGSLEQLEKF